MPARFQPSALSDAMRRLLPKDDPLYLAIGDTPAERAAAILADPSAVCAKADAKEERVLQAQCENDLRTHGIEFLHIRKAKGNKIGWPDLTFCASGWPIGVELKTETGKVTREQADCHDNLRRNGWRVYIVRSWAEWRTVLDGLTGCMWGRTTEGETP